MLTFHFQIEEDNPIKFQHSVSVLTMKLFADLELKRRQNEDKISEDARRKREHEIEVSNRQASWRQGPDLIKIFSA